MATVLAHRGSTHRLRRTSDEHLVARVRAGDAAAFEALYDRHHASLLAFCRHMVGSREDGEDALQQTFVRAHGALVAGRLPDAVRPWLYAIARNRCRTLLAARRAAAVPIDEHDAAFDGLADDVRRRADLRQLVTDLAQLPDDQREALVLSELGDLTHPEIATAIGCSAGKVKALVFQARTALIAERDARGLPCEEIRGQLDVARGGALRRGPLRRHLRQCDPCRAYSVAVVNQRAGFAWILPVAPTAGLKAAVLAGAGASGTGGTVAAAAAVCEAVSAGSATTGGGAMAGAGGLAVKGLVAKAAVTVAVGVGASGAVVAVHGAATPGPPPSRPVVAVAQRAPDRAPAPPVVQSAPAAGAPARGGGVLARAARRPPRARAVIARRRLAARARRFAARRLQRAGVPPRRALRVRRAVRRQQRVVGISPRGRPVRPVTPIRRSVLQPPRRRPALGALPRRPRAAVRGALPRRIATVRVRRRARLLNRSAPAPPPDVAAQP